jgi:DNA-binding LacI/PurR family transcriptional regulator
VSLKTVSNVVNGHRYLRPETKARVEQAIVELGYRVNSSARDLRRGRTATILLALSELRNPYFAELAELIIAAAERRGLRVLVDHHRMDPARERAVLHGGGTRQVDGVIYSPVSLGQDEASLFRVGFPLVVLGDTILDAPVDHVSLRNVEGARAAVSHLIDQGCSRIALIGVDPLGEGRPGSATQRVKGARQALEAAGLSLDPRMMGAARPWYRSTGAQAVADMLDAGVRPDGIFALNDVLALGALHELLSRNIRVPEDIALVGFDNIDDGLYSRPSLTTIDPGKEQIAELALSMLCERMGLDVDGVPVAAADPLGPPPREVFTRFELVVRETSRAAARAGGADGLRRGL